MTNGSAIEAFLNVRDSVFEWLLSTRHGQLNTQLRALLTKELRLVGHNHIFMLTDFLVESGQAL